MECNRQIARPRSSICFEGLLEAVRTLDRSVQRMMSHFLRIIYATLFSYFKVSYEPDSVLPLRCLSRFTVKAQLIPEFGRVNITKGLGTALIIE